MKKWYASLRARLVMLVVLAVVPAAGLILYNASIEHETLLKSERQDNARLVRLIAMQQTRLIEGTRHLLIALSRTDVVRGAGRNECGKYLADLVAHYSWYSVFAVAAPNGDIQCHSRDYRSAINIADRPYFQRVLQTRDFVVGEYQVGRASGQPSFSLAYPITDRQGTVTAVIFASVRVSELERLAKEIALPARAVLISADRNGTIVSRHPGDGRLTGKRLPEGPLLDAALRGGSGTTVTDGIDGVERVYSYAVLGGSAQSGFFTAVGMLRDDILAPANRELAMNLAGLAAVILLSLLAAWVGGDAFVLRHLQRLAEAARRLSQGELGARSGIVGAPVEIAEVSTAFDHMARAFEERDAAMALVAAIVESSDDAIVGKDLNGIVTSWNPGAERLFGYSAREMIGSSIMQLIPPARRTEEDYILGRIGAGRRVEHFDTVRIAKDGRAIDVSVAISPIRDASGVVIGASKVARDIGERKQTEEALQSAHQRLRALSARLHQTHEAERQGIAHELHEEICQAVAAIKMNVQAVQNRSATPQLAECLRIADAVLRRLRALSVDLRPPQLNELGLEAAVRAHVERCTREGGVPIDFRASLGGARFDANLEATCFRVAQEALLSAIRRPDARQIWIELAERDGELCLTVADDGRGFDMTVMREHPASGEAAAMAAMLERVRLAGGLVEIVSSPELGTEIRATWPLAAAPSTASGI